MKTDPQIESVCSQARWPLTTSDKYVIRVIWNRYRKLYKQQQQGKLKRSGNFPMEVEITLILLISILTGIKL